MKRVLSLAAILLVVAAIIVCEKPEPEAPTLIEPEDGAVFDTVPPTFIWSSDEFADDYVIRIYMGSSTDIQDTLSNTTYAMSKTLFETLLNGTYNWTAAAMSEDGELFWSESWSFVIDKPEEPQGLDFDTTYFPLGLGYEWCYERHSEGYDYIGGDPEEWREWDNVYNITVKVIDSLRVGDTLQFSLQGGFRFLENPVNTWNERIPLKWSLFGYLHDTISIIDPSATNPALNVSVNGDTLNLSSSAEKGVFNLYPLEGHVVYSIRLKGIGAVYEKKLYCYPGLYRDEVADRLLYFYNGQDTVYKAD